MGQLPDIDKLDHQILSILMRNVKIPYTEIAKKLPSIKPMIKNKAAISGKIS